MMVIVLRLLIFSGNWGIPETLISFLASYSTFRKVQWIRFL